MKRLGLIALLALLALLSWSAWAQSSQRIRLTVEDCRWSTSEIVVDQGSRVALDFRAVNGEHRFKLPAFHVDVALRAGGKAQIEFVASKPGRHAWSCTHPPDAPCEGTGGTLVVREKN